MDRNVKVLRTSCGSQPRTRCTRQSIVPGLAMTVPKSPYSGKPEPKWLAITKRLVDNHPLRVEDIRDAAAMPWKTLWGTTVGESENGVRLSELDVPATVVGYFFARSRLANELGLRFPGQWRKAQSSAEKDLVYLPDQRYSIELKTSGQRGNKIYGNRERRARSCSNLHAPRKRNRVITSRRILHEARFASCGSAGSMRQISASSARPYGTNV